MFQGRGAIHRARGSDESEPYIKYVDAKHGSYLVN